MPGHRLLDAVAEEAAMSRLQSRVAIVAFAAVLSASCSGSALSPTPLSPLTAASAARSVSLEGTVNAGAPPPSNVHLYLLTVAGKWVEHRMYEFNEQGQQLRGLELPAPTYKVGAMFFDRHNNAMYLASSNATSASGNVSAYDMQTGGPISLPGGFPKLWHPAGGVYDSDTHFIYVLDLLRDSGRGIMRVYDEQGNPVKTSGDFKNIGIVNGYGTYASSSIAYDSHNGRIYVLSYGTCSTCIGSISAYDGQGHQIPFSGTFGGNQLADAGILYDSSTRQIYVA